MITPQTWDKVSEADAEHGRVRVVDAVAIAPELERVKDGRRYDDEEYRPDHEQDEDAHYVHPDYLSTMRDVF